MSKTFFIDTSRCTACRGCQVACKEWQGFKPVFTKQLDWGSHQNPPDLTHVNYKVVKFSEFKDKDRVVWNFFPDQCRHCMEPPCKLAADIYEKDAVVIDPATGAVIFTKKTKNLSDEVFQMMKDGCPYNVPRRDPETGLINKCDMCLERIEAGQVPVCVKTCPTGAMNFGDRKQMMLLAQERLNKVREEFPDAQLLDAEHVRVVYLITHPRNRYHYLANLDNRSKTSGLA